MNKDTVHFLVGQKKLEDKYKDPNVLSKINKPDMAGMMESIEECIRAHPSVIKAPLVYIIMKTITVQTNGDYPTYATQDDEIIARMLHLPSHKNRLQLESSVDKVKDCKAEYIIDNRMIYDILDMICKDTNLYPVPKQHKATRDGRGAFMPFIPGG